MAKSFDGELEARLLRYVQIDTASDETFTESPSTAKQLVLLRMLVDELRTIGAKDVKLTDYGAVVATIPANGSAATPTVAFLAHVDTASGFSGEGVKPIVHRNYQGHDIVLPDDPSAVISPADSAYLAAKIGDDIVTASGTTLLGADDKAGVSILMTMAGYLLETSDVTHGPIRICFTPDEEIGRGVHASLPSDLQADIAYTLDGVQSWERSSTRRSPRTRQRCTSRAYRSIRVGPGTSLSMRSISQRRLSKRCRKSP